MTIDKDHVNNFARKVVEQYEETSVINSLSDVREYTGRSRDDEFVQYGGRVPLPKDIFREDVAVREGTLSTDFAGKTIHSEKNHILSAIDAGVEEDRLSAFEPDEFSFDEVVLGSSENVYEPDWLFIPNNTDYRHKVTKWMNDGRATYEDRRPYIRPPFDIKVEWVPNSWGYTDAYLFDSSDIRMVQKKYKNTEIPDYIEHLPYFDAAEDDDRLMTYMGEHGEEEDSFEFFYRIVLTNPKYVEFNPYAATIARLPDDDNSEDPT